MNLSQRKVALLTGVSIIIMAVTAGVTMGMFLSPILQIDSDDIVGDNNFKSALFNSIMGWLIILITDFIVSWGLYKLYLKKNKSKSTVMGLLRFIYSVILAIAIYQLIGAYLNINQVEKTVYLLHSFESIWQFGLIVFGFHLMLLSGLVCEKKIIKKVLAILLLMAGVGYTVSNTLNLFIENYEDLRFNVELVFIIPMIFGELGLAIWLLTKGGKNVNLSE